MFKKLNVEKHHCSLFTKLAALTLVLSLTTSIDANAQGFLKKLKDRAVETVKNKVADKVDNEVGKATDNILNGNIGSSDSSSKPGKSSDNESSASSDNSEAAAAVTTANKTDFVRGGTVFYEDNMKNEKVGEFPSKWNVTSGQECEIVVLNGTKVMKLGRTNIEPLMKQENYLPDEFTIEFDIWTVKPNGYSSFGQRLGIFGYPADESSCVEIDVKPNVVGECTYLEDWNVWYDAPKTNGLNADCSWETVTKFMKANTWTHVAISFNQRAFKMYINGNRIFNIPNMKKPDRIELHGTTYDEQAPIYIKDFVMAKGAVELYGREATDGMEAIAKAIEETGKFVTNNILFETGKADLKAESMTEIQKVAEYMKKNPSARFLVVGHTDNVGSAASNQTLSENRAKSVVAALAKLGVDDFNLKAEGRGASEPVADNKSDAGKAKNRRVEFIKK